MGKNLPPTAPILPAGATTVTVSDPSHLVWATVVAPRRQAARPRSRSRASVATTFTLPRPADVTPAVGSIDSSESVIFPFSLPFPADPLRCVTELVVTHPDAANSQYAKMLLQPVTLSLMRPGLNTRSGIGASLECSVDVEKKPRASFGVPCRTNTHVPIWSRGLVESDGIVLRVDLGGEQEYLTLVEWLPPDKDGVRVLSPRAVLYDGPKYAAKNRPE